MAVTEEGDIKGFKLPEKSSSANYMSNCVWTIHQKDNPSSKKPVLVTDFIIFKSSYFLVTKKPGQFPEDGGRRIPQGRLFDRLGASLLARLQRQGTVCAELGPNQAQRYLLLFDPGPFGKSRPRGIELQEKYTCGS
jgi:hypothetical protein